MKKINGEVRIVKQKTAPNTQTILTNKLYETFASIITTRGLTLQDVFTSVMVAVVDGDLIFNKEVDNRYIRRRPDEELAEELFDTRVLVHGVYDKFGNRMNKLTYESSLFEGEYSFDDVDVALKKTDILKRKDRVLRTDF